MRIAVNTCKDTLRSSWMRHIDNRQEIEALPLSIASCAEERLALTQAIMALAPKHREIVLLYYYQDMSLRACAQVLQHLRADRHQAAPAAQKNSGFAGRKGLSSMKKDPTIREAIDESLCSVRFNAQDERAVLAAIHGRRAKAKKRVRRLNFAFAMGLLVLLVAPVTAFTLHSRRLGTTDIAAPGSDPILSPAATAAATASAPPAATPLRALTEQEALQAARACFESVCDTSVFSFDEYAVSCERQGDAHFVLMTSIYGNGCTFSVTVDALTGEILQHSPVDLATQPASDAAASAEAKTWTQKFGSNLFSWSADDQTEYARRYKGATSSEPRSDESRLSRLLKSRRRLPNKIFEATACRRMRRSVTRCSTPSAPTKTALRTIAFSASPPRPQNRRPAKPVLPVDRAPPRAASNPPNLRSIHIRR